MSSDHVPAWRRNPVIGPSPAAPWTTDPEPISLTSTEDGTAPRRYSDRDGRDPLSDGDYRFGFAGPAAAEREARIRDDRHRDMMALLAPAAASFVAYARPGATSPSARDAWHMIRNASLLLDALDAWERGDEEPGEPSETAPEAAG